MSPYALETFGSQGQHFKTVETLIADLRLAIESVQGQVTILVKGSRGMQMERVVGGITENK
jgi:UDP-N-acetylmuramyl pentapeptide synthase